MDLRELIELGYEAAGGHSELAKTIGIAGNSLTDAKAGRRGIPNTACGKLAEILGIDPWTVVCASELVTEKNEEKRSYLSPFVLESANDALIHRVKNGAKTIARASSLT